MKRDGYTFEETKDERAAQQQALAAAFQSLAAAGVGKFTKPKEAA